MYILLITGILDMYIYKKNIYIYIVDIAKKIISNFIIRDSTYRNHFYMDSRRIKDKFRLLNF